jgi:molybdopterin/thiamine biosynthesis adenylyltransferase
MKITIIGIGALGSHVALFMRNVPKISLTLIDDDKVETKNLSSQAHTRMGLGKNKAQSLAQFLQGAYQLKVTPIPHRLGPHNIEALLGSADLVIDCVDNGETRQSIQDFVRKRGIACLHGGVNAGGTFGLALWDEDYSIDHEDEPGQATACEGVDHLPFMVLVASVLAATASDWIKEKKKRGVLITPMTLKSH